MTNEEKEILLLEDDEISRKIAAKHVHREIADRTEVYMSCMEMVNDSFSHAMFRVKRH